MDDTEQKKRKSLKDTSSKHDSPRKLSSHVHFDDSEDIDSSTRISSRHRYLDSVDYSDDFDSETKDSPRTSKSRTGGSYSVDYSEDFESDTKISQIRGGQQQESYDYSDDFETDTKLSSRHQQKHSTLHSVSSEYSDDFESEVKTSPRRYDRYNTPRSVSFSTVETTSRLNPRQARRFSSVHSVSSDYSDLETDTKQNLPPRKGRRHSSVHSVSSDYSDLETDTKQNIPTRKGRRYSSVHSVSSDYSDLETDTNLSPRHRRKYSTQRSLSTFYSSDFETDTFRTPRSSRQQSVTFQYSEDFESDDDLSMTVSRARGTIDSSDSSLNAEEEEAKHDFVKAMLRKLKRPKPSPRRSITKAKQKTLDPETEKRINTFCQEKIQAVKNVEGKKPEKAAPESCRVAMRGLTADMNVCDHGISPTAIARLKIQNTLDNLHKAANTKIHEPFKCQHCRDKMADVAAEEFIRKKKALAMKRLVEENMETFNRQCNDPIYLMGEIVKDLPNMNTDPHVISQKLLKPLEDHKQYIVPQHDPEAESGNVFWRMFFSRLQEHPGKEYLNLYDKSK